MRLAIEIAKVVDNGVFVHAEMWQERRMWPRPWRQVVIAIIT